MTSLLSGLSPVNSFPDYHGPYAVGTVDVELPAADLTPPSDVPERAQPTIAFRIFYPCVVPSASDNVRPVRWVPQPQRDTVAALIRYLGFGEKAQRIIPYLGQQFYWIKLHAHRNARLLDPPTSNGRWPVTFFSHGLAGSRNAYSYVCGDLASNGTIVIALDHRDGSSPIQYVRATADTEAHVVDPVKISHEPSLGVWRARDKQLRIRLWEISMAYEALLKIDAGLRIENLDRNTSRNRKERVEVLWQFDGKLDIHRAGKVSFVGHSFGAATMVQLLKSVYYAPERAADDRMTLIRLKPDAAIVQQILAESPIMLLDLWGLPLLSPDQKFLWDRPLPSWASDGPKGDNVISILSEAFYNWTENLDINKHTVAGPSRSRRQSTAPRITREKGKLLPAWARLREHSPSQDSGYGSGISSSPARSLTRRTSRDSTSAHPLSHQASHASSQDHETVKTRGPHTFYISRTQHFNQSDFGILFPFLARRFAKAEEPVRCMELNTRAIVQVLRECGLEIPGDDDKEILSKNGTVRRWVPITVEDEDDQTLGVTAMQTITRKLSTGSNPTRAGTASSTDGMTMGRKVQAQTEN